MIEINKDAKDNFNSRAQNLIERLTQPKDWDAEGSQKFDLPKPYVSETIDFQDVDEPAFGQVDDNGILVSRYFLDDNKLIGLDGAVYQELVSIAESMQHLPGLYTYTSVRSIETLIFKWVEDYYLGQTKQEMVSTVLKHLEQVITENEIWIPVPHLIISHDVKIGNIVLRTIDESLLDQWQEEWVSRTPEQQDSIEGLYKKYRKRFQGRAAVYIKILAEPNRAEEIAFLEAERSISVLRYFDPVMQDPEKISYCGLEGRYLIPRSFSIFTESESKPQFNEGYHGTLPIPWTLSPPYLAIIRSNGLDILSTILADDARTPFQQAIIDSILIYTKSALESEPIDKLIYILAALETILLRNKNERIRRNARERMAKYIGDSPDDKEKLISDFNQVYDHRCDFLHHGQKREDNDTLRRFMVNTWLLFNNLLLDKDNYITKNDFLRALDDKTLAAK